MANREELVVIRAARAGQASAQLALGKRYLFGGAGLPKSETTALYWLDRAAHQQQVEAWLLIGSHIPFEAATKVGQPALLCVWYERAFDSGVLQAGLVLAKLVLAQAENGTSEQLRRKAWMALESVAHAGIGEAQWLMAQLIGQVNTTKSPKLAVSAKMTSAPLISASHAFSTPIMKLSSGDRAERAVLDWTTRAADGGVMRAQLALAEYAWRAGDHAKFLQRAVPLARHAAAQRLSKADVDECEVLRAEQTALLARCATLLMAKENTDRTELEQFLEAAAIGGEKQSCLALGLWFARMDSAGNRLVGVGGLANYKKALRWLSMAAGKGLAEAWFVISRIYLKPEFSQRNVADAMSYARKSADGGYGPAQFELGITAWRGRRQDPCKDIEAVYWLDKAAVQGNAEAAELIQKIADKPATAQWALQVLQHLQPDSLNIVPLLKARLELAIEFGLSRAETLLLDISRADCGHCLAIDIRAIHPRSKRRLVMLETNEQRHLLNRVVQLFDGIDGGMTGPEGNYRQRLYRLRMLLRALPGVGADDAEVDLDDDVFTNQQTLSAA